LKTPELQWAVHSLKLFFELGSINCLTEGYIETTKIMNALD
jgi:hypothetical protein